MTRSDAHDLVFYFAPQTRSIVVEWMLGELQVPFARRQLDLSKGEHRQADYLAINPMGKVPSITHNGAAVSEVAAICTYLADAFPERGLSVPVGDPERGPYLKWLFFGPSCIEPAISDKMFKRAPVEEVAAGYGTYDRVMQALDEALSQREYLVAHRFTAADVVVGSHLGWGMMSKVIDPTPAIGAYMERLQGRPAFQDAFAA